MWHRPYNLRAMVVGEKTGKLSGNVSVADEASKYACLAEPCHHSVVVYHWLMSEPLHELAIELVAGPCCTLVPS